jgi:hypothetical protein
MDVSADLALLRLLAQRLAGPRWSSPAQAVARLGAAQAQDLPGALTSIALRTHRRAHDEVVDALNSGHIVRSWPMRGTLHLVAAEDLGWLLSLTSARMLSSAAGRRASLGITDQVLDDARALAIEAVRAGTPLRRQELFAHWREANLLAHSQTAIHLLGRLCQEATLVLGPLSGREQLIVEYVDWVRTPRQLAGEQALAELARRFISSHGPVTSTDFARWSSLTRTAARAGFAAVQAEFEAVTANGAEQLMDPSLPELLRTYRGDAERLLLLPGFDEFILGYADRSFTVPPAHSGQIVPGNNGMFRPTIISAGQVIGTWKRAGTTAKPRIGVEAFAALSPSEQANLDSAFTVLPGAQATSRSLPTKRR